MRQSLSKLLNLFRSRTSENEMSREMAAHLALIQEDFEAKGFAPEAAKLAARRAYGGIEQAKELHRDARSFLWVENALKDIRYGIRNLSRTPGFTTIAVIVLALGIGANTAIFSVVNAILLEPLAYKDSNRLVTVLHNGTGPVATANYFDWRDQTTSFQAMGAADYWSPNLTATDPSDPTPSEHLYALKVTQNLLPLLGVPPLKGRLFLKGEDREGANHEVVLGYSLWQRNFRGDPEILGKIVTLDGEGYSVVGIMPPTFKFAPFWATKAELWVPNPLTDFNDRGGNHLRVFARLKPGVTLGHAQADMATVTARLEKQYPATNRDIVVRPLKENVVGNIRTPLLMMLGSVAFVLLIACANVAHMLLARTADRQKEVAVRVAVGAGKARLLAQFLTENLLLASFGAAVGLLLAWIGTKALVALSPDYLPRVETVAIDTRAVLFLIGITVATALIFGLTPAMHAAATNLSDSLKEGGRGGTSDGAGRNKLRGFLVASEFALAFMLLIGAGLMVRSFYALQSVDTGFDPHNVQSMVVSVAGTQESPAGRRETFYRDLLEKLRGLPGVVSVGAINHLPLVGDQWDRNFEIEGRPKPRPGEAPDAVYRIVLPGYFQTMRLPLKRGRTITYEDSPNTPHVVVVNEELARRYWPNENPIGKRFTLSASGSQPNWLTVIGVVPNASLDDMISPPYPEMYLAALQVPEFMGLSGDGISPHMEYITLVVRGTQNSLTQLPSEMRQIVQSFDRNLTVSQVLTMDEAVATSTAQPRFEMLLLSLFGALALVLAAVGIYGVMNYAVSRRTREIGIRMSLGASRGEIFRMIVVRASLQAIIGTAAGVVGAILLSKLMAKLLFGVQPTDPATFVAVTIVLGLTALLATAVPARNAMQIDPMTALRTE
jgi:putative ABC transport system permease protein